MKILRLIFVIFTWIFAAFLLLMALCLIPSYGTVFILIFLAIMVVPVDPIRRIWSILPARKVFKPIIIFAVFLTAVLLYHPTDIQTDTNEQTEAVIVEDNLESVDDKEESSGVQESVKEDSVNVSVSNQAEVKLETQQAEEIESAEVVAETEEVEQLLPENTPESVLESLPESIEKENKESAINEILKVHFIDVGQGDAILITCGEDTMLIDAGDNSYGTTVQKYLMKQGVDSLDYVVITHPDADHLGGMDVIIYKYDCGIIFMPDVEKDTVSYQDVFDVMDVKYYSKTSPKVGDEYKLGNAIFQIISPALTYSETNNNSIVIRLVHGDNSFLFTGDIELQAQQEMAYSGFELKSTVMKIPHHGGKGGYQKWFYNEVQPEYAVISCGINNSYGHPNQEVLESLREFGVQLYRTDEQGNIVATSDGKSISWNTIASASWNPGTSNYDEGIRTNINQETDSNIDRSNVEMQSEPIENIRQGAYAVNGRNGKIHIVGGCNATEPGAKSEMKNPIYVDTYEEAEGKSFEIDTGLEKRKCGNCW